MTDVFAGRLMSSPVESVSPSTPVREAAKRMLDNEIGSVVVTDESGDLQGILTTTDFVRITAADHSATDATVADYMTTDVVTATANDPITDVADTMIEHGFHHLPICDEAEGVIGMLTTTDLTEYLSHFEPPQLA
ncbi:CBS domain-containing protein [Halonotius terrestris]|uniref:CBS domain-containing protein n=1 Tax=Halonotius terrestris TaxID=2487750 RepID=A0A8J8PDB5_9EURY|nr:CBS domain-containing protein [Halonotius terrestris]TQQ82943.1 CBS domain-containing protein [Halonotius terrestris]